MILNIKGTLEEYLFEGQLALEFFIVFSFQILFYLITEYIRKTKSLT